MKTEKLYYENSYLSEFDAYVIECVKKDDHFEILLNRTCFFPESGGQESDTGYIDKNRVYYVEIRDDLIYHYCKEEISTGKECRCCIDFEKRYSNMQNHTGEHIISGIASGMFGCNNVGFHLSETVTVDFDVELSGKEIEILEIESNKAVCRCLQVTTSFPSLEEQNNIKYRSKIEINENLRLVSIEGVDVCACCAPHVKNTGEIGIIKILSSYKHRGGTRINLLCGNAAVKDLIIKNRVLKEISDKLRVKPNEAADAFNNILTEISRLKSENNQIRKELRALMQNDVNDSGEEIIFFADKSEEKELNKISRELNRKYSKICYIFSGEDSTGYSYIISINNPDADLKDIVSDFNSSLNGVGGGKGSFFRGRVAATRAAIEKYIKSR